MTFDLDDRPRRAPAEVLQRSPQGAILATDDSTPPVELNITALALWDLCDGRTTVSEMADAVLQLFDISPERATADVTRTVSRLRDLGMLL